MLYHINLPQLFTSHGAILRPHLADCLLMSGWEVVEFDSVHCGLFLVRPKVTSVGTLALPRFLYLL